MTRSFHFVKFYKINKNASKKNVINRNCYDIIRKQLLDILNNEDKLRLRNLIALNYFLDIIATKS
ncbi:hypothetical protein BpHYR1_017077 [Brachionus plicatilis]|uniref:Uncharacterized protein n=1 Tax=Brachionus plicatilis TaxID=10195 RepID=A0A3M7RQC0_BRAPC|nr:hypothetical protein BpHYR1_017077 [Brachionus plicatilis]